jgi:hypothetical protein
MAFGNKIKDLKMPTGADASASVAAGDEGSPEEEASESPEEEAGEANNPLAEFSEQDLLQELMDRLSKKSGDAAAAPGKSGLPF